MPSRARHQCPTPTEAQLRPAERPLNPDSHGPCTSFLSMSMVLANSYKPVDAAIGGLLIGLASGVYMLLTHKIAGNSGILKILVLGKAKAQDDASKLLYFLGLVLSGIIFRFALPEAFDLPVTPTLATFCCESLSRKRPRSIFSSMLHTARAAATSHPILCVPCPALLCFAGGFVVGVGVTFGNGCTSGHGLCGLSRFSLRSLVAVPTFMVAAIATSTISTFIRQGSTAVALPAAPVTIAPRTLHVALVAIGVLALALSLALMLTRGERSKPLREALVGLWCGMCSGTGLTIGGMVRPSVIMAALSPARVDFSLWELFMVALLTTFLLYRLANRVFKVSEACAAQNKRSDIDKKLIVGALLFGIGWGASGYCPGPLIVAVASNPADINSLLCLLGTAMGVQVASHSAVAGLWERRSCAAVCQAPSNEKSVHIEAAQQVSAA